MVSIWIQFITFLFRYAIALNYASEAQGTKQQLVNAPEVKIHLERALSINPQDATTWMILGMFLKFTLIFLFQTFPGMWHFAFADMASYTRLAARAIYATPPSSTYEEAMDKFQKAEALQVTLFEVHRIIKPF